MKIILATLLMLIGAQLVLSELRRPGDSELRVHWRSFKLSHCKKYLIFRQNKSIAFFFK